MATVRQLMSQLKVGVLPLEQVVKELRYGHWPKPQRPEKTDVVASYQRAEEMPGDNDVFWIREAFMNDAIDQATYTQLIDAIRASWEAYV